MLLIMFPVQVSALTSDLLLRLALVCGWASPTTTYYYLLLLPTATSCYLLLPTTAKNGIVQRIWYGGCITDNQETSVSNLVWLECSIEWCWCEQKRTETKQVKSEIPTNIQVSHDGNCQRQPPQRMLQMALCLVWHFTSVGVPQTAKNTIIFIFPCSYLPLW